MRVPSSCASCYASLKSNWVRQRRTPDPIAVVRWASVRSAVRFVGIFNLPYQDPRYIERSQPIAGTVARHNHRDMSDYYTQAGNLFRLLNTDEKERLIVNISGSLSLVPRHIQERQLWHFFRADPAYGEGVAKAIGISVDELVPAN